MKVVKNDERKYFAKLTAERDLYPILREMGHSKLEIDKFQKKRFRNSLIAFFLLLCMGLLISSWFYGAAFFGAFLFYKSRYKKIKAQYNVWKFQRHLQFSRFTRLLIPYLKQSAGKASLYSIFNRILIRMDNEEDRNSLYRLMTEMTDKPNDIQPFKDYAERSSGTDMAETFMSTIFDYQQTSFDSKVITKLGKISNKELIHGIDEIINYKLKRFAFFPTKIVMSCFVIVLGFTVCILLANLPSMQF